MILRPILMMRIARCTYSTNALLTKDTVIMVIQDVSLRQANAQKKPIASPNTPKWNGKINKSSGMNNQNKKIKLRRDLKRLSCQLVNLSKMLTLSSKLMLPRSARTWVHPSRVSWSTTAAIQLALIASLLMWSPLPKPQLIVLVHHQSRSREELTSSLWTSLRSSRTWMFQRPRLSE